jgi:TonB family protein
MGRVAQYIGPSSLLLSLVLHTGVLGTGVWLVAHFAEADPREGEHVVDVELTRGGGHNGPVIDLPELGTPGPADGPSLPMKSLPEVARGGRERAPVPDTRVAGRGGERTSDPALGLADAVDGLTLNREALNHVVSSQVQRLRTASTRRSWDDRRATPNPMELDLVVTGEGHLSERLAFAQRTPARGYASSGAPARAGGVQDELSPDALERSEHASTPGPAEDKLPEGAATGKQVPDYQHAARVTLARPMVLASRAAVPAQERDQPRDTVDSPERVNTLVASLVHASAAGGALGPGAGGEPARGAPGRGGEAGPGMQGRPAGSGLGGDVGHDARFSAYIAGIPRKVNWERAFPSWAIAEGRGGLATIGMTLRRDGSVAGVHVVRSSGLEEFDRNLVTAVRRAAPFGPIPEALQVAMLQVNVSFDATNPAVGRDGPGRGRRRP